MLSQSSGTQYSYDPGKFRECLAEKPWHAHGNLTPWIGHFYPELAKVGNLRSEVVLENSNVEKLASNLYLSVHSLPQEGHDETDDASAGEV
jgi:hypothetical protein